MTKINFQWIQTPDALKKACVEMGRSKLLCVDTEFHREDTYAAEFALLQIASREACYIIDPLAIDDLSPVWEVLCNPDILKAFHAARQDVEIIYAKCGKLPLPLFDTQVAAALLGYGQQIGFGNLVQRISKVTLAKQESFSNWMKRPLTPSQCAYAAEDVIYLMPVVQQLQEELQARKRESWLDEEQATLCSEDTYTEHDESMFWRVKQMNKLRPAQLAVLREITAWRERQARRKNIPRRRIVGDEQLLEMAKKPALSEDVLLHMRGLSAGFVKRFGKEIVEEWNQGRACPEEKWPRMPKRPCNTQGTDLRAEMLDTLVKLRAEDEKISALILANKSELAELASWGKECSGTPPELECLKGWRKKLVGNDLLHLLRGEVSLKINPKNGQPTITSNIQTATE
ncbi:MAG: ribonuclease D [Zetaproteobacteria bacterium]|nr:ribonuclease D [Zetaproteobacteria bacterium]